MPSLLARATNRILHRAKTTTSDADILRRRWLLFDFDPKRPAGISATDAEHNAALARAGECLHWLRSLGFASYVFADSGNGAHVLLRIDLPNDKARAALVKRCLEAVALQVSDDNVVVDLTVYNAARICKLYGTLSCKGDHTPDRPHRISRILEVSKPQEPASPSLLENLASLVPDDPKPEARYHRNGAGAFNLHEWITAHNLDVIGPHSWNNGQKWVFPVCPFNSDHSNRAAVLLQFASGAVALRCLHNGCAGNDWHALRDLLEPEWRADRTSSKPHICSGSDTEVSRSSAWPVLAEEALYGLAGEIVRTIDPYTEADPVAVLLNVLTAFGNCVNGAPHARVQHDNHPAKLFVVQVGDTSKGRKGTGWSTPRYLFSLCDADWAKDRVKSGLSSGEGLIYNVRDPIYSRVPVKEEGRFTGEYEEVCV